MRRRTRFIDATLWLLHAFPVTLTVTTAIILIGISTGTIFRANHQSILDTVGFDLDALKSGRFWTMPAATLIQADPGIKWYAALLVLILGPLEYLAGSLRALVTFFLSDWVSTILTTLALWALATMGSATAERFVHRPDMGSSAASFGAAAAVAAMLPGWLGPAILGGLFVVLGASFAFQTLDLVIAHFFGAMIGVALGGLLWRTHIHARQASKWRPQPVLGGEDVSSGRPVS